MLNASECLYDKMYDEMLNCTHDSWIPRLFFLSCSPSGRPLPPSTASSSLLPPAPSPPSAPLHQAPPTIRECQVPLLDSSSAHTMLEPHPEDQISPNSYLLRAQTTTGKLHLLGFASLFHKPSLAYLMVINMIFHLSCSDHSSMCEKN